MKISNKTISEINVAYSCNESYVQHTGISIISLYENNKDIEKINVFLIEKDIKKESIECLQNIIKKYDGKLIVIPFIQLCRELNVNLLGRHIETVYAKLFFGNLQGIDKVLYLDSDTIINGSIKQLWLQDLSDNFFGCVRTPTKNRIHELGMNESEDFYNDGVALVNCKLLNEKNMEKQFVNFINSYNGNPPVLSEGTMNKVCKNKILTLHPKYNFSPIFLMFNNNQLALITKGSKYYTEIEIDEARESPIIIHYLTGWYNRPWHSNCTHPLKNYYLYYKSLSPWSDTPLTYKVLDRKAKKMKLMFTFLPIYLIRNLKDIQNKVRKLIK